jgi:hypothetical protein
LGTRSTVAHSSLLTAVIAVSVLAMPGALAQLWDNVDGRLGSLAPENLNADRPAPDFDLTGAWYISGEWVSTKRYQRQHRVDFLEVHCLPQHLNKGILGTSPEYCTSSGQ